MQIKTMEPKTMEANRMEPQTMKPNVKRVKIARIKPSLNSLGTSFTRSFQALSLQQDSALKTVMHKLKTQPEPTYLKVLQPYIFNDDNPEPKQHPFPLTGTLLTGGTIKAPPEIMWHSMIQRAHDIDAGVVLADNDIVSSPELFCFFMDIDIKSSTTLPSLVAIMELVLLCKAAVKASFTEEAKSDTRMTVLLSTPKPIWNENQTKHAIKVGIHLVFSNVIVRQVQAIHLTNKIIAAVAASMPEFAQSIDLDPFKDKQVNLRPAFSLKRGTCVTCQNIESSGCPTCHGSGRSYDPSVYVPLFVFAHDGTQTNIKRWSTYMRLKFSTIRAAESAKISTGYVDTPNEIQNKATNTKHGAKHKGEQRIINTRYTKNESTDLDPAVHVNVTEDLMRALQSIIPYKTLGIVKITHNETRNMMFIDVVGDGQYMCIIKGKGTGYIAHKSNRVFFILNLKNMSLQQHCYDAECRRTRKDYKKDCVITFPRGVQQSLATNLGVNFKGKTFVMPRSFVPVVNNFSLDIKEMAMATPVTQKRKPGKQEVDDDNTNVSKKACINESRDFALRCKQLASLHEQKKSQVEAFRREGLYL